MTLMLIELAVVLTALWIGARYGSLALGGHFRNRIGHPCFRVPTGTKYPTDGCYLHHHRRRDLCRHSASIGGHGLDDTDSRKAATQTSRPHHYHGPFHHLLSHHLGGYRTCGLHAYAHHL